VTSTPRINPTTGRGVEAEPISVFMGPRGRSDGNAQTSRSPFLEARGTATRKTDAFALPRAVSLAIRQEMDGIPVRSMSVQPQGQVLPSGSRNSSLPGTPHVAHGVHRIRASLPPAMLGDGNDAIAATETTRPRRSNRSATPAAASPSSSNASGVQEKSAQKRHIQHVTVPIQIDGKTTWRKPSDMPPALVDALESAFYSTINTVEKVRLWGKYQASDENCALTYIIGRGSNGSAFASPFRACNLCTKRGRLCAKLVVTADGEEALGFHPLSSKDRATINWKELAFYVNSK
jgi:hypothetical protein